MINFIKLYFKYLKEQKKEIFKIIFLAFFVAVSISGILNPKFLTASVMDIGNNQIQNNFSASLKNENGKIFIVTNSEINFVKSFTFAISFNKDELNFMQFLAENNEVFGMEINGGGFITFHIDFENLKDLKSGEKIGELLFSKKGENENSISLSGTFATNAFGNKIDFKTTSVNF